MKKNKMLAITIGVILIIFAVVISIYGINVKKVTNQVEIAKIKDNVNVIPMVNIPEERIYMVGNTDATMYKDVNITNNSDIANKAEFIIIGTVDSIDGTVNYNPVSEVYVFPRTVGKVKVNKVIKGNLTYSQIPFMKIGGVMTISEYEKTLSPSEISKMGIGDMTEEEKQNTYIKEMMSDDIEIKEGNTYLMYLRYDDNYGAYVISYLKYGLREINTEQTENIKESNARTITTNEYKEIKVKNNENGNYESLESIIPENILKNK